MPNGAYARPRADQWRGKSLEDVAANVADDLDEHDRRFTSLQDETKAAIQALRTDVQAMAQASSRRSWWVIGLVGSLLVSVMGVLVAVIASQA